MTACQGILVFLQISPPAQRKHKPLRGRVSSVAMRVPTSTVGNVMWVTGEGTVQLPCSCPEQNENGSRAFVQSREKQAKRLRRIYLSSQSIALHLSSAFRLLLALFGHGFPATVS